MLSRIEAHKQVPASLRTALQAVAPSLSSDPYVGPLFKDSYVSKLFDFVDKVRSEAGKTLTDDEAGQLMVQRTSLEEFSLTISSPTLMD